MKRNSSNSSDAMDWMELSNEATRLDNDRQYLSNESHLKFDC
jgi:hypothetical protein